MKKLKINELEVGKTYTFTFGDNLECALIHRIKNNRLQVKSTLGWEDSILSYNNATAGYFTEIQREIDWSKVPRGTKVQVRDGANEKWKNAYFLELDTIDEYPFRVSFSLDDNFTEFKMEHRTNCFDYCRIHPTVEIPDEWYKEVRK